MIFYNLTGNRTLPLEDSNAILLFGSRNSSQKCVIPDHPANGHYNINGYQNLKPGAIVNVVYLNVTCLPGYQLIGDDVLYCFYGSWSYEKLPLCINGCRVEHTLDVEYRCLNPEYNASMSSRDCEDFEPEGTVIQPKCRKPIYYSETELSAMLCVNGSWNSTPKCVPACGSVTAKGVPLLVGGVFVDNGEVPWHAAIFKNIDMNYELICGGSIISETIVLSAAHCFWHTTRKKVPAHYYAVSVGQLYREWINPHDQQYAQRTSVKEIILSKHFYGAQLSYQHDIAVVIVEVPFKYTTYIKPVCLDFRRNFNSEQLQNNSYGKVAGWGLTTGLKGSAAPRLKAVDIPFVSYENCIKMTRPEFIEFLVGDKICAGYGNGTALCKGDSGGGLAFPVQDNGIQRYYLRGIVSTSPVSLDGSMCNLYSLTSFTEVIQHASLIEKYMNKVQCANGQIIPAAKHCDGVVNCVDGSDETAQACSTKICPSYFFRCSYGACADVNSACNGILDCTDRSDESNRLCNRTNQTYNPKGSGNCVLPPYPEHGSYSVVGDLNALPGDKFPNVFLNISCAAGYELQENRTSIFCYDGTWSREFPKCIRFCKLNKHASVDYHCLITGANGEEGRRDCALLVPEGTIVRPECRKPFYYSPDVLPHMRCIEGRWDYVATCSPECGRVTSGHDTLIISSDRDAQKGKAPWHASVYRKNTNPYRQICGGSLVSSTIVISAAHCFWSDNGSLPASNYAVALGKMYKPWNSPRDSDAQKSDIRDIAIPDRFQGSAANFQDNIALLILVKEMEYNVYVRPVCVDFDINFERSQLREGNFGKVAVWDLISENNRTFEGLKVLTMPYVEVDECISKSPSDFREYITSDKICAGHINGKGLCRGDTGAGFAFPISDRGIERYYLRGIASTTPNNSLCFTDLIIFTQLIKHEIFITKFL